MLCKRYGIKLLCEVQYPLSYKKKRVQYPLRSMQKIWMPEKYIMFRQNVMWMYIL